MQESGILDYHPSLSRDSNNNGGTYEESPLSLDTICYPYFISELNSPLQEETSHSCVYGDPPEEVDYATTPIDEVHGREEPLYGGYGNWLPTYDSCFDGHWGHNLFSFNCEYSKNEDNRTDDSFPSEEQSDSYGSYHNDIENLSDYDYSHSWFGSSEEENSYEHANEEPISAFSYSVEDLGKCEGIFGYWPCLYTNFWSTVK